MPLMAHKDNGFHQATSSEVEALQKAGWELCDDPMEYKRRVWGIGVAVETAQEPEQEAAGGEIGPEPEAEPIKRRGRPRRAD
jgi:hypothetical protein